MTSSYYPVTTDNFFDNTQTQSMPPITHYSSYQVTKTTTSDDDDDDDLDALRKAALKTLNSKKRKNTYDDQNSRSSSRSYSSSSRSSYTHSSISRSYSSSSLSSISSNSLDKNDKDYRFEIKEKQLTADIDERFPQDIPNDNDDMLVVNCPIQDDDIILRDELKNNSKKQISKKSSNNHDERNHHKSNYSKEIKQRKKSPSIERPISITVKLNSDEFDLRQLIKKRRTDESSSNNHRTVQILPKDNHSIVHKTIHDRLSSGQSEKNRSLQKYHKH